MIKGEHFLMRKYLLLMLMMLFLLTLAAQPTLPCMYVQKTILDNGKTTFVTWLKDNSAPEYHLRAWILECLEEIMNTVEQLRDPQIIPPYPKQKK